MLVDELAAKKMTDFYQNQKFGSYSSPFDLRAPLYFEKKVMLVTFLRKIKKCGNFISQCFCGKEK